ncbi:MAG: hypothetical protein HQL06_00185 [Nitrospirae bacterium]|nr:hypothetical protein [Nitrospirota bacterium]
MLRPTKHSHPDRTVISVALLILKRLKKQRVVDFDDLLKHAKKSVKGGNVLFLPALNFLYTLGLIEYQPKTDVIEYVGLHETICPLFK